MILHGTLAHQTIDGARTGRFVKELVVAGRADPIAMVRKRAAEQDETRGAVLLVHGFGQNRYAFHLPSRSLSSHLASVGYDVFNVDLRGHGRSRQLGTRHAHGVAAYVEDDLPAAVESARRLSGHDRVFLLGHSLGGLVSYAAAPRLKGELAGVITVGSPYHFTKGSIELRTIATVAAAMRAMRLPDINPTVGLAAVGRALHAIRPFVDVGAPVPLRGWRPGSVEPEVLLEHVTLAFDRAGLAEIRTLFEWALDKRFGGARREWAREFEATDVPLLVIAGEEDDLAPAVSVRPAFTASRSSDKSYLSFAAGHIDLLIGRDAPKTVWPTLDRWLGARVS